ncbi:chemotaxis protein CheD [Periweissella fabaria]|uniref:Probable chemoreceptor glutamine deamidase CheD n=1 Tax=Periweissella fabaria TaxID=546157 RepID=A0ABM8Z6P1_9LACO|nr:chemotaxis protein CheD [Periweissella fabaria]MCM0597031.1 chemotaxis protein CheD [Periweissella fabaria]CAH0416986.1 Chemoreceptor glutamine deamidase CheD [Periweissella fabaria]
MTEQLHAGIAEYKIGHAPQTLAALGLGSCVATVIYDEEHHLGGISHIMLPDSTAFRASQTTNHAKFANLALPEMVTALRQAGATGPLTAKIAGGAQMFKTASTQLNIGQRNIMAVEATLAQLAIPIVARHVGGTQGRTMMVDLGDFSTMIRIVHEGTIYI